MKTWIAKTMLAGAMLAMTAMVACQKKSDDNNNNNNNNVGMYGGCTNCVAAQGVLFTAPSTFMSQLDFNLRVVGDANQMNQLIASNRSVISDYRGSAFIDGTLIVRVAMAVGNCMIPPGQYQVNTVQAGQFDGYMRALQVPQFQASNGSTSFLMSLNGGTTGAFRVVGQLMILKGPANYNNYNGYNNGYNQGIPVVGNSIDCNDYAGGFILN